MTIDSFTPAASGGLLSLAPGEDGIGQPLDQTTGYTFATPPNPAPGVGTDARTVYFYLQDATGVATATAQNHTVHVWDRRPDLSGAVELCNRTQTYNQIVSTTQASANKVTVSTETSNPPSLGAIMRMTVSGNTGTVGNGSAADPKLFQMTPAAIVATQGTCPVVGATRCWNAWRPDVFELRTASVNFSLNGAAAADNNEFLHWTFGASAPNSQNYTVTYEFRIISTSISAISASPIQYISSGTQTKHTDLANYSTIVLPILPIANKTTITKSASPTVLPSTLGGTVTYTVTAANCSSGDDAALDNLVDTLPSGATYVSSSSAYNGSAIGNPIVTGSTLLFLGPFSVPRGTAVASGGNCPGGLVNATTRSLTYQVTYAANLTPGVKTNSVVGHIGAAQIDTTTDTSDNSPATSNVTLQAPPVANPDSYTTPFNTVLNVNAASGLKANDTGTSLTGTLGRGTLLASSRMQGRRHLSLDFG